MLTTDVKSWKLIAVSRETIEEALKNLSIEPKMLPRRSNVMWNILLATEQEARQLVRSVLMSKAVWLQIEYMGIRGTKITIHGVPVDI